MGSRASRGRPSAHIGSRRAATRSSPSLVVTAWGNIIASFIGPIFGGRGLVVGISVSNTVMYVLFVVAVITIVVAMA